MGGEASFGRLDIGHCLSLPLVLVSSGHHHPILCSSLRLAMAELLLFHLGVARKVGSTTMLMATCMKAVG